MKTIYKAITILVSIFLISCSNKTKEVKQEEEATINNIVELSADQYKTASIELGKVEMKKLSGAIKANGKLDVPPQNMVSISAPLGGFVKNTELLQGMKVTKGQVIAIMEHPDYIQMQQDYLDGKSQLEFLEAEYKRQQELSRDNVNSQKTVQQSKAQFFSMQAKVNGLKSKLNLIGISPDKLSNGEIQNTVTIVAPITGYVTKVHVNIGLYVNPNNVMFEIVDTEHLHAELTVFEKDVTKIQISQKVRFTLANESKERFATVYLIGREISSDRTVRIHCHLDSEDTQLLPGMFLKAYVETGTNEVSALPEKAIVDFEGKKFIYLVKSNANGTYQFEMVEVQVGLNELGYTEILLPASFDKVTTQIVINGAYDLLSKMKNSEE